MSDSTKPILTITGSDPIGGSGVQADVKVITALGGYAVTAITSITIQNTLGIQDFYDVPAAMVEGQIEAIVNDVEPATVKIGMIRTLETLDVVVNLLHRYRPRHVVYMPVTHSVQGDILIPDDLATAIGERLMPLCTVVIPHTQFSTHGEANTFASTVAYYLNEGMTVNEAISKAHAMLDAQSGKTAKLRSRSQELYALFIKEVEEHYRSNSDVRFYADRLNVASGYLAQVTRRIRGISPKAIIDEYILHEAQHLLLHTTETIQETAYTLGFNSQAHFSKFFKKLTGTSPTQYISSFRHNDLTT